MTTERGFIALARGILDHPIVGAPKPYTRHDAWEWLLFEAAWKPRKYAAGSIVVDLERGQLAHSTRYMAKAWGWPETSVRRFLRRLKTGAMIGAESGAGITVISICNYEFYQSVGIKSGAPNGAANGAKVAHERRRKEQGNKETKDSAISEGFAEWYSAYPRKKARQDALKAYCKLLSSDAISHADLMVRTRLFADHWKSKTAAAKDSKRESGFCPYPASWLNSGEYADEIEAMPQSSGGLKIEAPTKDARTFTDSEWRDRLAMLGKGQWSTLWGPKPGEPLCLVPARLLVSQRTENRPQADDDAAAA
jgi:hypothetical protein